MVFSGVYYPPEVLPPIAFEVSMAIPSTHIVASLRAFLLGGGVDMAVHEFLIGGALALVVFLIGANVFRVAVKKGKENGTNGSIRVPLQLIRAGVKLTNLLPATVPDKVNESLQEHGVTFDLNGLKDAEIEEIVAAFEDLSVDIHDGDEHIRVFTE